MFYKLIKYFNNVWRCFWSNLRWTELPEKCSLLDCDKFNYSKDFKEELSRITDNVFSKFKYTYDDLSQLLDSMRPPKNVYAEYKQGTLKDDCDGYHACLMYIMKNAGIDCGLLTFIPKQFWHGHTIFCCIIDKKYYLIDYYNVYGHFKTLENAVDYYNKKYEQEYKETISINLCKYTTERGWYCDKILK